MIPAELDDARMGRAELLAELARLRSLNAHANANLTAVQVRCNELLLELRSGIRLPGWTCQACGVFVGAAKEVHAVCRCCGAARP
jgi:hypothetical protein